MTRADSDHWDRRYADHHMASVDDVAVPRVFAHFEHLFPTAGSALDLACGRGRASVWLAARGLTVWGVDISPVAIDLAQDLATASGVTDRCRFDVVDLDRGLPNGTPVDVLLCHKFRDPRLDEAIIERLAPGGLLAIATLSAVGKRSGPFRTRPDELKKAFGALDIADGGENDGLAWLLALRREQAQKMQ